MKPKQFVVRHKDFKTLFFHPTDGGGSVWSSWKAKVFFDDKHHNIPKDGIKVYVG